MRRERAAVEAGSLILLLLSVGLLAMLFLRTRRQQQELMGVQSRLAPGQEVMTGSGMFATVVEVTDTTVLLRAESGQTSRWDRRAVVTIVPGEDPDARHDADAQYEADVQDEADAQYDADARDDTQNPTACDAPSDTPSDASSGRS